MRARFLVSIAVLLALVAATRHRAVSPGPAPLTLNARRSFVITEKAILDDFSFARVLNTLIFRSGVRALTAEQLYRQLFDTQNPSPGLAEAAAPHCDDFVVNGQPSFNGFPRRCPTGEGKLAAQPYASTEYIPIGLTNRFDLAPADGSNCGEYRMIFARKGPSTSNAFISDRLHIIFEAVLPNPNRAAGLAGCRDVAQFWADLSKIDSLSERRAKIVSFYFDGVPGIPPVIDPNNYGMTGGRIRTMQFTPSFKPFWRFYQFRVDKVCPLGGDCALRIVPDVLQNLPFAPLINAANTSPQAEAFRQEFLRQIPNLAIPDVNLYFMDIPSQYLLVESDAMDSDSSFNLTYSFSRGVQTPVGQRFRSQIQAELARAGSTMPPEQLVMRAQTLNCDGCHELGGPVGDGVVFPRSIDGLQHITESNPEIGDDGGIRYVISPALRDVFIPHRMQILRQFLTTGTPAAQSKTIGGGRSIQ